MPLYPGPSTGGGASAAALASTTAKADGLMGSRKPRIAVMGNSHCTRLGLVPAIMYSLWRYYPADIIFDYRAPSGSPSPYTELQAFDASKGDIFGVGGTTTTSMVNNQIPRIQAAIASGRVYDLVYICDAFYNDTVASSGTLATAVTNVITTANALLTAGVRKVVIVGAMPQAPGATSGIVATWAAEGNQLLRNYVNATQGVEFCELSSLFASHNETTVYFNKPTGRGNVYGGYTVDGVHLSGNGRRILAMELSNYHRAIARPRRPRNFGNQGTFDYQNKPTMNVLGDGSGNVSGTNGLKNNAITGNVGGLSANSRIAITDINNGNNVLTPSIIITAAGYPAQRITLSGAAAQKSGNANVSFTAAGLTNLNNGVLTRGYDFECIVDLTGVTGLSDLYIRTNGAASDTPAFTAQDGGAAADLWLDNTTEPLFMYQTIPETYGSGVTSIAPTIWLGFTADRTPSGTIDFSRMSFQRVTAD